MIDRVVSAGVPTISASSYHAPLTGARRPVPPNATDVEVSIFHCHPLCFQAWREMRRSQAELRRPGAVQPTESFSAPTFRSMAIAIGEDKARHELGAHNLEHDPSPVVNCQQLRPGEGRWKEC